MDLPRPVRSLLTVFALIAGALVAVLAPVAPAQADVSDGWVTISVGGSHTCGVTTVGEAFCWGNGNEGQLGDGTTNTVLRQFVPLEVAAPPGGATWSWIDAGNFHTCALTSDADIYCWGIGSDGEIGNGDSPPADFYPNPTLVDRPVGVDWATVDAGRGRNCALTTGGDLYCWGRNDQGQLGVGDEVDRSSPTLVPRQNASAWESVDVGVSNGNNFGSRFTCGVNALGQGFCWGDDEFGNLGDGVPDADVSSPTPVDAPGVTWVHIRPGLHHACGVDTDGDLRCWGDNRSKQLGLGSAGSMFVGVPALVSAPPGVSFADVDAAVFQTCALSTTGALYCWGSEDLDFSLGDGNDTSDQYDTPNLVADPPLASGPVTYTALDVGEHVCALDGDDDGWCWGPDSKGQLGDDSPALTKAAPAPVGDRTGGPQDLLFLNLPDSRKLAESPVFASATATSGLPAVFLASGQCSASGRVITLLAVGSCTVTATQPGDADWDPATPVSQTFTITSDSPTQTFQASFSPSPVGLGEDSVITFTLAHPLGTLPAQNVTFDIATFGSLTFNGVDGNTCDDGSVSVGADSFDYSGGTLEIGESCEIGLSVTAPTSVPSLPTSRSVSGGFLESNLGPSNLSGGASLLIEDASGLAQTITFDPLSDWPIGDGDRPLSATASSGLPVAFAASGVCSLSRILRDGLSFSGPGNCTVTASQAGDGTFAPAPDVVRKFDVTASDQTIDFPALSDWPLDSGERVVTATATSTLPVSFAATGSCSVTGSTVSFAAAGTCTVTASQPGNAVFGPAPEVERSFEVTRASAPGLAVVGPVAPTSVGTDATFQVSVADVAGLPSPGGAVRFTAGSGQTGDVTVVGGVATWTTTELPLGSTAVDAQYLGDTNFLPAAATGTTHDVVTAALSASGLPSSVEPGDSVTFDVTGFFPGEDVAFVFNSDPVALGTVASSATGAASLTFEVPNVEAGNHSVTATGADSGFVVSADTSLTVPTEPTDPGGPGGPGGPGDPGTPPAAVSSITPVSPARLADTRDTGVTIDGQIARVGKVGPGETLRIPVHGRGGVPASASAVVVNTVAVAPEAAGFLTLFPCDEDRPSTSSVNYRDRPVDVNNAIVKLSSDGALCVFSLARTHVVLDVTAYAEGDEALPPKRLAESRSGRVTDDGRFAGFGRVDAGSVTEVEVAGRGGVPADAVAVAVNVTAVLPSAPGFLTLFPCDADRPNASNLNYAPGDVRPNAAVVALSATGTLCVFSLAETDVILDVTASFQSTPAFTPLNPARLLETRTGGQTVDGVSAGVGRLGAGTTTKVQVAGRGGVPAAAAAAAINAAAVLPSGNGFVTLFPCDEDRPNASSMNYVLGDVIANSGVVKLAADGSVCVFTLVATDLVLDVNAAWTTPGS